MQEYYGRSQFRWNLATSHSDLTVTLLCCHMLGLHSTFAPKSHLP